MHMSTREECRHGDHNDTAHMSGKRKADAEHRADDGGGGEGGTWRVLQLVDEHQKHEDGESQPAHETCSNAVLVLHVGSCSSFS